MYKVVFTKDAASDAPKLKAAHLDENAKRFIDVIRQNPYCRPPSFEKLKGDMAGAFSRRINHKHRLVYEVFEKEKTIKIISMWNHYDD